LKKISFILFIFLSEVLFSQAPADSLDFKPVYRHGIHYTFKMRNGDIYSGYVKDESRDFVVLENRMTHETVEIRKSEIIVRGQPKSRNPENEILGENYHAKNYMLLSSAFLFDAKKASTNSHWLILENIEYAFSEHWAISLNTLAFYPISIGAKCNYQIGEDNYVGASVFVVGDILSGGGSSLLFGYGAQAKFTKGISNKNFTLSGGLLGLNSELFYTSSASPFLNMPFVSAAYCNRFSKSIALNFEGWYLPDLNAGLAGVGIKFVGDESICWTLGCYALLNGADNTLKVNLKTLPIPYFGVARKFN